MTSGRGDLQSRISDGVLAFPATAFHPDGSLDRDGFIAHVADLAEHLPRALVVCGSAGELFSLNPDEHKAIVQSAVDLRTTIPVIAGVGHGLAIARDTARTAERCGADAVLLLPPYLTNAEQDGLAAYVEAICSAVGIPVLVYSRNNGVISADTALRLADSCPNFLGLKDGTGKSDTMQDLLLRGGDRLTLINGAPTAELLAAQYESIGIRSYSSAAFAFVPTLAKLFFAALRTGDRKTTDALTRDFYLPLVAIRNRRSGYAVAIVKAGLRAIGRPAGPVRPPLLDLTAAEENELAALIERGLQICTIMPLASMVAAV